LAAFLTDELGHLPVERVVLEGDPASSIVAYASENHADLIVMPTHGYGPFRRFLLGSVTAKVLHDARCPVWTGPHLEQAPVYEDIRFRKVLCAVDLAEGSECVMQWAAAFAREFGAELAVVHAIPGSEVQLGGLYFDPDWRNQMAKTAREQVQALQEQ